jgi:hypothetical protein
MAEVQQQEEQQEKPNVIDISKFFGGKTLSSADIKVNKNQTLKTKPSFIAAPELASLLDVVATSVEDKNNTIERIKSVERIREREIVERSTSDSTFRRVLNGLRFDVDSISKSYSNLIKSLESDRKNKEKENRLAEDLQKQNETRLSKERVGSSLVKPTQTIAGEEDTAEEQPQEGFDIKKFLGATAAAAGLGGLSMLGGDDGEGDPGQVDPNYKPPSGKSLNVGQLKELALSVGFNEKNASIAAAVAMGESGGDSSNDTIKSGLYAKTGETSYGLWQINMTGALGPERIKQLGLSSYKDLYDPVTNARAAFKISGGSNWNPWTVYTKGKYLPYLKEAQTHKKAGAATAKPAAASTSSSTSTATPAATTSSTATPAATTSSTVAAAPQKPQTPQQIAQEESSMSPAVASAAIDKIKASEITPTETGSQSPPIMISQSPPPRSSGGSYDDGETVGNVPGFSSTNPDNLYTAYALKELNIV